MIAPAWLLLAPLAWGLLLLLERWRRQPLRLVVADLGLFTGQVTDAPPPRASRRPSRAFWWRAAACAALAGAAAGPEWTSAGRVEVDLVFDRGLESGFEVGGEQSLTWHRGQLLRVLDTLDPNDRVHLTLVPARGGIPPLSPADARRVLAQTPAVAARGDLEQALRGVSGLRPAFVAAPGAPTLDGIAQASWALRGPNRGIAAVAVTEQGVDVAVVGVDVPGPCEVELEVSAGGVLHAKRVTVELPARGSVLARWEREAWPFDAAPERVAARLLEGDALALDDSGFAVREGRVRVGLATDPGPEVERALRAVPGTEVVRADPEGDPATYDLIVVEQLASDAPLPATAVVVIPAEGEPGAPVTVRAAVDPAGAFAHTVDAVFSAPFSVTSRALLPQLQGAHAVLQTEAGEPLVLVRGRGKRLVVALGVPPRRAATSWVDSRAFPFFWAELIALASAERGQVRSRTAGALIEGERVLEVGVFPPAAPRVGTVAAALPERDLGTAHPFAATDLEAIETSRPRERTSCSWLLFALALGLGVWSLRDPARTRV